MKTKTTHTPGPWKVEIGVYDKDYYIHSENPRNGSLVAQCTTTGDVDGYHEAYANANLIAAAPELLNQLRIATEWLEELADLAHEAAQEDREVGLKADRTLLNALLDTLPKNAGLKTFKAAIAKAEGGK